jgi:hypothetical protein
MFINRGGFGVTFPIRQPGWVQVGSRGAALGGFRSPVSASAMMRDRTLLRVAGRLGRDHSRIPSEKATDSGDLDFRTISPEPSRRRPQARARRARRLVVKDRRQPSFLSRRARGRLRNFNSKLRLVAASFWDDR